MSRLVAKIIVETFRAAGIQPSYDMEGDTLNGIAGEIEESDIEWVPMQHEEAGAFGAQADSLYFTGSLTAVVGSCGTWSLHFINGVLEVDRNRAPVILAASQITRDEFGLKLTQEVNFQQFYRGDSVYCEMILIPDQAHRKTVAA